MKFFFTIAIVIVSLLSLPYLRIFLKRIVLCFKVRKACKHADARFVARQPLWWLGGRLGTAWDFANEKQNEILIVKLFSMKKRSDVLYFIKGGSYMIR